MQRIFIFAIALSFLTSCSLFQSEPLSKKLELSRYRDHLTNFLEEKDITEDEFFLLNYAIVRQRSYFNYEIEDQTYADILAKAKQLQQEGLPLEQSFNKNGQQDAFTIKIESEGGGLVQIDDTKSMFKALKFTAQYTNTTDRDLALATSSFIVRGPFQDHITTAGFVLNCEVPAGGMMQASFVIDARDLKANILYNGKPEANYLMIDKLLKEMKIEASGCTINENVQFFNECLFGGTSLEPENLLIYEEVLPQMDWQKKGANGQVEALFFGDAHYPPVDEDEPVPMEELQ